MTPPVVTDLPPPPALARDVEVIRITRSAGSAPFAVKTCPNGTPGLVDQRGDGGLPLARIETRSKKTLAVPELFLHGQGIEPSVMSFSGVASVIVQVVLKPQGLFSVFGLDGSSLVLDHRTAEEFQGEGLRAALASAESDEALFEAFASFLVGRQAEEGKRDEVVEKALVLVANAPSVSPDALAADLALSPRQLQRRFLRVVGCPLKTYLRLRRANLALALIQEGTYGRLTDVAYALNYADQSHFIRDIKAFTWIVPRQLGRLEEHSRDGVGFSFL